MTKKHTRLFLAIDASGKTDGDVMKFFWEKFNLMIEAYRADPFALEQLHIDVSFFNHSLYRVASPSPIFELDLYNLKINFQGRKSSPRLLGRAALNLLEVITKDEQDRMAKKFWSRPIICFFTAGLANDTLEFTSSLALLQEKAEVFLFCLNEDTRLLFSSRYPSVRSRRWGELRTEETCVKGAFEIFDLSSASASVLTYPFRVRFFS